MTCSSFATSRPTARGLPAAFIAAGTATIDASWSLWQVPKASLT